MVPGAFTVVGTLGISRGDFVDCGLLWLHGVAGEVYAAGGLGEIFEDEESLGVFGELP